MMRIGLVSDTHVRDDLSGMPSEIVRAFKERQVDLILHLGDLTSVRVLDVLEEAAPVVAVRDFKELPSSDPRLSETRRVIEVGGKKLAMVHDIGWPGPRIEAHFDLQFPEVPLPEILERKFGQVVDIVAFGHTHEELACWHEGVFFVNPGSPTFPGLRHRRGELGTLAIMTLDNGDLRAEILNLARAAE